MRVKIGVFDSGVGGLSVANALGAALPEHEIIFRNDQEHLPYGTKPPVELLGYVVPVIETLLDDGCQIIVVACNTVSTTFITDLRKMFPKTPFVALEPMVKPAAQLTRSGVIAVCATPTTLASARYAELKQTYAPDIKVLEPDCSDWALMIEENHIQEQKVAERITEVLDQGADVIVLACTHYHWIEKEIATLTKGRARVLQPEQAIVNRVNQLIAKS